MVHTHISFIDNVGDTVFIHQHMAQLLTDAGNNGLKITAIRAIKDQFVLSLHAAKTIVEYLSAGLPPVHRNQVYPEVSRLVNWIVTNDNRLRGTVYNDSRFPDGTEITTSPIDRQGSDWVLTRNTLYYLVNTPEVKLNTQFFK